MRCGAAACCSPKTAHAAIRAFRTRRPTRSRRAISTPSRKTIRARCARISSATTRPRRRPKWARSAAARCTPITWPAISIPNTAPRPCAAGRSSRTFRSARNPRTTAAATTATSRCSTSGRRRRSCTTTRSVPRSAASRRTRRTISSAAATSMRPASSSIRSRSAWSTTRASTAASSSTGSRCTTSCTRRSAASSRRSPTTTWSSTSACAPGTARRRRPSIGTRRRRAAEGQLRRPSQRLRAQAVHRRPLPREARSRRRLEAAGKKAITPELQAIADDVLKNPARFVDVLKEKSAFIQKNYETCTQTWRTRATASARTCRSSDKKALTAFLATL